jgi:hypothetical protein
MNKKNSCRRSVLSVSLLIALSAPVYAAPSYVVTSDEDSGAGTLREALNMGYSSIRIAKSVGDITIDTTLEYAGESPVSIKGKGQTIRTSNNITLLAATRGADLSISDLAFEGPGGFDIYNRGDLNGPAGKGIFVDVRDDQTGTVKLVLSDVSVTGVANHGIHVSDCSLADDCGAGSGGGGEGSDASIMVVLNRVTVDDAGNGKFDADGLRVDERGEGSIDAFITSSTFSNVGADGVELDEGNNGDVNAFIKFSDFTDNGGYCHPDIIGPFVPDPDEGKFDPEDQVTDADIPAVFGSPDDSCIERAVDLYDADPVTGIEYVEEFEFAIDTDDGIDIDEAGEGSLNSMMLLSTITGNLDEGVDYDEEDAGSINAVYVGTASSDNADDGYKHSEEGEGDVKARVVFSSATDNGGKGFVFEEEDEGDVAVKVVATQTANNDDSDDTGIEAVQEDEGTGTLKVRNSDIADGIDTDGVDQI